MGILITLIALSFVIFIHELGHMLVAKKCGIGVIEFSIGMGPKIISKTVNETMYSFRLLPFGGFVKLCGLDDEKNEEPEVPEEKKFQNKTILQRMSVIVAGSFNNIILGYVMYFVLFLLVGVPQLSSVVNSISPNSAAMKAGIQIGDHILSINQESIDDVQKDMIDIIHQSKGESLAFTIKRDDKTIEKIIAPDFNETKNISLIGVSLKVKRNRFSIQKTIIQSTTMFGQSVLLVFKSFQLLFSGNVSMKDLAGPVGIVQFASHEMERGIPSFFQFVAMISIALGVINLFPFPVLDGGHMVFLGIEGLIGRPLNQKLLNIINTIGIVILISLMLFVVTNDIVFFNERRLFLDALPK